MPFDPIDREYFLLHFEKHGAELGARSPEEYEAMADRFMNSVLSQGKMECVRPRPIPRMICRYSTLTQEYGVKREGSYLVTYFILKPEHHRFSSNLEYYKQRCK